MEFGIHNLSPFFGSAVDFGQVVTLSKLRRIICKREAWNSHCVTSKIDHSPYLPPLRHLSQNAPRSPATTLVSGTVLSPLGDCKCISPSLPGSAQVPLQLVVHTVARVTFPKCPSDHVTTKRPLEMASIVFPTTPSRAWSPLTCPIFPPRSGGHQTMGLPSTWPPPVLFPLAGTLLLAPFT